jgi:hypothetical protein
MSSLTDADCQNIAAQLDQLLEYGYYNSDGSLRDDSGDIEERIQALMMKLLPDKPSLDKFQQWSRAQTELNRQLPQPASAATLIKTIEETDFLNLDSRTNLCDTLGTDLHYHIDLGTYGDYHYCLKPDLMQLVPEEHDIDQSDSREILPNCILGIVMIRTNPWSGNRRKDAGSDESSSSNSSTGNDETGFTFMQLGRVDYLSDASVTFHTNASQNRIEMPWWDSGFVLVVAIEQNGTAGSPWLIYNFRPESEIELERVRIPQMGNHWGVLLGDNTQRVGMKIGEKISDLKSETPWNLSREHGRAYSTQIVAAVVSKETSNRGRIFRQKVYTGR